MHKTKYIIFKVLIAIVLLTSCEKWLDLKPENDIIRQEFWQTKQQVHAAVMGCYASILESNEKEKSRLVERMFLWTELRGDMVVDNVSISDDKLRIMVGDIMPLNGILDWQYFYKSINICNTVIDFARLALETDETFTESELKAYEAEAIGLRSLLYFYLVRSFGEVPLMLESVTSDQDEFFIPKSPEQEIITQLISDLETAAQFAPESYGNIPSTKGRITKYAIYALLADIYLWNEQYNECVQICDSIINSQKYGLVNGENWFEELFVNGNSNESIFELQFDFNKKNPFYDLFHPSKQLVANPVVFELYEAKDIRGDSTTFWASFEEMPVIYKYIGLSNQDKQYRASDLSTANFIIYRYADILLMKAEAQTQLKKGDEALELLNQVQTRAKSTLSVIDLDDYISLENAILLERQKELAHEGKRWYDILRNARRNNYKRADGSSGYDIILNVIDMVTPADKIEALKKKYSDPRSHFFPIYYKELEVNKQLVQNSYYTE